MRTIAVANQKGGCGKTTVSINLAAALADLGHKTLLVDMDPQGHCAVGLGLPDDEIGRTVIDLLIPPPTGEVSLSEVIWQINEQLDLLPATLELARFEPSMANSANREKCLLEALGHARGRYEFVIIDCPPSLSLLTFNAMVASDEVLIPVEAGYFALHGLSRQLEVVESLQVLTRHNLGMRVVCNLYDVRTKAARRIVGQLREHFDDLLCRTVINLNARLKAAASVGQPITEFDRSSSGFDDFIALANELIASPPAVEPLVSDAELLNHADSISRQAEQLLADSAKLVAGSVADRVDGDLLDALESMDTDAKIDHFYGVMQTREGVAFAVNAPDAETVCVAGDFNDWSPHATPMWRDAHGRWSTLVPLERGLHEYRLVIDGRWTPDPHNEHQHANPFGEANSIVEVE